MEIKGLRELDRELRKLSRKAQRQTVTRALREAAKPMLAEARAKAPVGSTGKLKRGIVIRAVPRLPKGNFGVMVGVKKEVFYARFLEFGTRRMAPKPFLRPSYEQGKNKAVGDIAKRLKSELNV